MSPRQAERSEATHRKLLDAARAAFTAQGYAATSVDQLLQRTGLSKGALYYQFKDKRDLFRAVFEEVQQELTLRLTRDSMATNVVTDELRLTCDSLLDACLDPAVRQVLLMDGPAVLGWDARRPGGGEGEAVWLLEHALEHLVEAGRLSAQPLRPLAIMLQGALNEASMAIAHADDPARVRAEYGGSIAQLLSWIERPT